MRKNVNSCAFNSHSYIRDKCYPRIIWVKNVINLVHVFHDIPWKSFSIPPFSSLLSTFEQYMFLIQRHKQWSSCIKISSYEIKLPVYVHESQKNLHKLYANRPYEHTVLSPTKYQYTSDVYFPAIFSW